MGQPAMPDLPTGTVTFLLTDIEGSTALWERAPAAMQQAAARHDALIEAAVAEHDGVVVRPRGEGDSRFAVFARASDAVMAALALQWDLAAEPWPTSTPLRVRVALHSGEAELRDGDYYGTTVNRCARLRAEAHGGQVLLSQTTADLVRDVLPDHAGLQDLGEHRLHDLLRADRVYQLVQPRVPADFPPLRSLDRLLNNVPHHLTSFVGREQELVEVGHLLARHRLLTLTGAGGCGKTRLAVQVAAEIVDRYPDGIWFVDLASLTDPDLVPQAVAWVLDVREQPGQPILTSLVVWLTTRRLLLVLDNCEHLIATSATLVDAVLRGCPDVQVLATSRELLGVAGEVAWRVPSLPTPDPRAPLPPDQLLAYPAVRLFTERAQLLQPAFAVTAQNAAAVAEICRRLDGIPLAIELGAARVRVLTAEQIVARLHDRFRLLTGGRRTAVRRQQTLQAAIDWSHDLLTEPERVLLRRLAVFVGGWTLEAAEAVGAGDGVDGWAVLDLLSGLVDKSLVVAEPRRAEQRYRLLETVRQYAEDKLLAAGEAMAVRERHRAWFAALAARATPEVGGPEQGAWFDRLAAEHDNLRAALRWMVEAGDAEAGLRLCSSLAGFWYTCGYAGEGRAWLAEVLALPAAGAPTVARGQALAVAAMLAWHQDDLAAARAACLEAVPILRAGDDTGWLANVLATLGRVTLAQRDYAAAQRILVEAEVVGRASDEPWVVCVALHVRGQLAFYQGEYQRARALQEEALVLGQTIGLGPGRDGTALNWLGHIAVAEGDYVAARACYRESLAARQANPFFTMGLAITLGGFCNLAAARGAHTRAARLAGAAARLCEADGVPPRRVQEAGIDARLAASRHAIGEEAFAAAWAEGRALTRDEAVAEALAEEPLR
jgi:predicted ATPase/class 3 adenylate cyclase